MAHVMMSFITFICTSENPWSENKTTGNDRLGIGMSRKLAIRKTDGRVVILSLIDAECVANVGKRSFRNRSNPCHSKSLLSATCVTQNRKQRTACPKDGPKSCSNFDPRRIYLRRTGGRNTMSAKNVPLNSTNFYLGKMQTRRARLSRATRHKNKIFGLHNGDVLVLERKNPRGVKEDRRKST